MLRPWALPTCVRRQQDTFTRKPLRRRRQRGAEAEAEEGNKVLRLWRQRQRQLLLLRQEAEGGK